MTTRRTVASPLYPLVQDSFFDAHNGVSRARLGQASVRPRPNRNVQAAALRHQVQTVQRHKRPQAQVAFGIDATLAPQAWAG